MTDMSYPEMLDRKGEIESRLDVIGMGDTVLSKRKKKGNTVSTAATQLPSKADTHWDFVMKEMMWLGADFQAERKRQASLAKKCASGVKQFHKTKETRRLRELHQAEMKRRKLAAKLGRDVKSWWTKIEKIVAYKQKIQADEERKAAMNKQLVVLVQQTEQYTESLTNNAISEDDDTDDDGMQYDSVSDTGDDATMSESDGVSSSDDGRRRRRRHKLTIEEALSSEHSLVRQSKKRVIDYARMRIDSKDFYGETTASDGSGDGTDASYSPDDDSEDDNSTLQQAIHEEMVERHQDETTTFLADPEELRKLREEVNMDIDKVVERLQQEGQQAAEGKTRDDITDDKPQRRVTFSPGVTAKGTESTQSQNDKPDKEDPIKYDADDDGDASDVEDYDDTADAAKSDEEDGEDGTTQQGGLGVAEDTAELKREGAMPLEELRKLYSDSENPPSEASSASIQPETKSGAEADDGEFLPATVAEVDDETTIEAEEKMGRDMSHDEEMSVLKRESEIPVEQLRAMYAAALQGSDENDIDEDEMSATSSQNDEKQDTAPSTPTMSSTKELEADVTGSEDDGGEEFEPNAFEAPDDETTIEAEERLGRDMSYSDEIALLKRESKMSVEELRAKYASMDSEIEEGDNEGGSTNSETPGGKDDTSELVATLPNAGEEDDEFKPGGVEVDDETTIEAEEKLGRDMSYKDEISLLEAESEIPVEKLRAMYAAMNSDAASLEDEQMSDDTEERGNVAKSSMTSYLAAHVSGSEDDGGEEFQPEAAEAVDDERTIEAEERLGRDMSYKDEIALLQEESEMSIDELRAKYAATLDGGGSSNKVRAESEQEGEDSVAGKRKSEGESDSEREEKKRRLDAGNQSDEGMAALDALEASAERARQTLASRPYMLSGWVKLRKYQQVGLNWLVSIQSRRLNGILADEMGLGKTLQTIALLSYLASYKGIWGPHLIVVPTSVIINWETELKRFCPALKVLCYYGSAKRRKELRQGWTKTNWYHVVITSYQLAVQDAFAFKRKKWYYLVLDEAQNIKNFQSQRWQTLINFNTQRRLLLTGTPLQNNLMELWSLLHFLMPYIFRSRKEFSYWFSNPMNSIIEGNSDRNEDVIKRLHGIIRPFVLRRLKKDVETQMPGKYEHIVKCQLSRRQMTLYEEFLSRSSTRQALTKGGNFMGMMNVLMQLRKVCNHPDLFEPRSVVTPFVFPSITHTVPSFVCRSTWEYSVVDKLSPNLVQPIWCGSSGLPSIESALRHDAVEASQLGRLVATHDKETLTKLEEDGHADAPDELRSLLKEIVEKRRNERQSKFQLQGMMNKSRCQAPPFTYNDMLLQSVEIEHTVFQRSEPVELKSNRILLTPERLLDLRRTEHERASDIDPIVERFVFCVPRAGAQVPVLDVGAALAETSTTSKSVDDVLLEPLEEALNPYQKPLARLSSFFPDKKLIQFDSGKLQTLAELLRKLKREGHRALIFTQMSKMLDVLEAFLNIHGHTYLRLDGATGVDRRQRYMDRFNNDTKVFCFILSTRSGGMGINLTGADTVIFYDSDWNPAMDAQAQDRAHRIGQTRDVHIYRLITELTIEENILMKAKQKKNLDIMVMDGGNFDASHQADGKDEKLKDDEVQDVYTKGGLRAILGVSEEESNYTAAQSGGGKEAADMSTEQMEMAMAALEDEDDVKALRGAQKEAAEELKEFDESVEITKNESDQEDEDAGAGQTGDPASQRPAKKQKKKQENEANDKDAGEENEETKLEKEFASWQTSDGFEASAIESSLSAMERYGLQFREAIDPFYSVFYINEMRRKEEVNEVQDDIVIEDIEREKAMEERQAMDDGDLLATRPRPENLIRQRNLYQRERARLGAQKRRRKLTGENWGKRIDGITKQPFWYNEDTGEALWDKPTVLVELEADELAMKNGWGDLPLKPLVHVMDFLVPYPERQGCARVCRHWRGAASDIRFVRHVYPVEMGALSRDGKRLDHNHYGSIAEALAVALPGDTIELSDGHYWVNEPGILFDKPVKLVGDEHNPTNVVIEMSGSVQWKAQGGWIEGVTFRRPKIATGSPPADPILQIKEQGRVDVVNSVFDNDSSTGAVVTAAGSGKKGIWKNSTIRNGGGDGISLTNDTVNLKLIKCTIRRNGANGIRCTQNARISLLDCRIQENAAFGVTVSGGSSGEILKSQFLENQQGVMKRESGCTVSCSSNTALVSTPSRSIPGFKITRGQKDKT